MIVVTKKGGEGECHIKLTITDQVERVGHDQEVPLWVEENAYFQTETAVNPRGKIVLQNC